MLKGIREWSAAQGGIVVKTKALALLLLTGGALLGQTRFFVGVNIGGYPPPVVYAPPVVAYAPPPVAYVPPCPGPGYGWVDGYWYYSGPHRYWRAGYWAPRYYRSYRVGPRGYGYGYGRGRAFAGYRGRGRGPRW